MNVWFAKVLFLLATALLLTLPHLAHRGESPPAGLRRKQPLERVLLGIVTASILLGLVWVVAPWLSVADRASSPPLFLGGGVVLAIGLVLLYRSHRDLGKSWSITLEVRDRQQLVTRGVYSRVRHPMYLALLTHGVGQALYLPNWIAGPAFLAAVVLLVAARLRAEERMMEETFGEAYRAYRASTWRILPYVL